MSIGSASYAGRRIDYATKQSRAEGYDEQARDRGEVEGHDGICPRRPCRRSGGGWFVAAADRASDLWQCQWRHTAHAIDSAIGIDLPLKALVWQDGSGSTWLSYNAPNWLA